MNPLRKTVAVAITALAVAALPVTAEAHGDGTPFENCPEAYLAGHANILKSSAHYGAHLDRDKDGVGCDKPPADFVPAKDDAKSDAKDDDANDDEAKDDSEDDGTAGQAMDDTASDTSTAEPEDTALAETGGNDTTPYIAGGGAAVLLAGGALLFTVRKRRATH